MKIEKNLVHPKQTVRMFDQVKNREFKGPLKKPGKHQDTATSHSIFG